MGVDLKELMKRLSPEQIRLMQIQGDAPAAASKAAAPRKAKLIGGYRSRWEAAYGERLRLLQATGEITHFWYECWTFKLADDCRYTPDFVVLRSSGSLEFIEVKGFKRDDAIVKFKAAAEQLTLIGACVMVTLEKGDWHELMRFERAPARRQKQ